MGANKLSTLGNCIKILVQRIHEKGKTSFGTILMYKMFYAETQRCRTCEAVVIIRSNVTVPYVQVVIRTCRF